MNSHSIFTPIEAKATGRRIAFYPTATEAYNTPEEMLSVIATALNMSPVCYQARTRVRQIVELRFVAALLLRMHFPRLTLQRIAAMFGGQDHTSVVNGISRAHSLLYIRDSSFTEKYEAARNAVCRWLGKDISAISA